MQFQLTPKRILLGAAIGLLFGIWDLAHGRGGGAQTIVVAAAMGLVVLAGIFGTLRGKRPHGTGALGDAHTSRHRLIDKILVCFVAATAIVLIFLALAPAE